VVQALLGQRWSRHRLPQEPREHSRLRHRTRRRTPGV